MACLAFSDADLIVTSTTHHLMFIEAHASSLWAYAPVLSNSRAGTTTALVQTINFRTSCASLGLRLHLGEIKFGIAKRYRRILHFLLVECDAKQAQSALN